MSDEIKEILDKAKEISNYGDDGKQHTRMFNQFEAKALLDYITNLQQKYEEADNDRHKLFEQKEKAVELLNETCSPDCDYSIAHVLVLEAIDILTGGDKE